MITLDTPIKFLCANGSSPFGRGKWPLPQGDQPGAWVRQYKSKPIMCRRGYHFTTPRHAIWHFADRCFLIEPAGTVRHDGDKSVAQGARLLREITTWNPCTQRLFAADCAERVAHLNPDPRVRNAIETARRYARCEATAGELAAALAAARDAWDAGNAAGAAARAAARDAGNAAGAAARAAARDAGNAARAAAQDAQDAAWNAETEWQATRLLAYLNGEITGQNSAHSWRAQASPSRGSPAISIGDTVEAMGCTAMVVAIVHSLLWVRDSNGALSIVSPRFCRLITKDTTP